MDCLRVSTFLANFYFWVNYSLCAFLLYIYIYAFSRRFYPKRLTVHSGYTCFITMCVPWESNPQPFALLTQCSTTEPQEHCFKLSFWSTTFEGIIITKMILIHIIEVKSLCILRWCTLSACMLFLHYPLPLIHYKKKKERNN